MKFSPYIGIVAIAFIIFNGVFLEPGRSVVRDNNIHLERAYFLKENIINNHKITGWNYLDNLGSPFLTYNYILSTILISFSSIILFIPIHIAYKFFLFLSFVLPSLMLYFLLSKKFNNKASFLISILFLFNLRTIEQILEGIWNQYLAISIFILFFYFLDKYSKNLNFRRISILSILMSIIFLTHIYVGLASLYLFLIYLIFTIRKKVMSLLIPILSFLINSFYFLPIITTSSWTTSNVGWGISNSFLEMIYNSIGILLSLQALTNLTLQNIILTLPVLVLDGLAIYGILIYLKERKNNFLKVTLLFMVISFIIGTGFWFNINFFSNSPLGNIISFRFLILSRLSLFIFAAFSLSKIKLSRSTITISFIILLLFSLTYFQPNQELLRTTENSPELNDYFNVINYLKNEVDLQDTRIVFQSPFRTIPSGSYTPLNLASFELKTPVIGSWSDPIFPISESLTTADNKLFNIPVSEITQETIIKKMNLYNARYIVTISPELDKKLKDFNRIKSFGNFTIFLFENSSSDWVSTAAEYNIKQWRPYPIIEINNEEDDYIIVKIAYHPFWRAYIEGNEVPVIEDENNLIKIKLKKGSQIIVLKYESNKTIYILLSLFGLVSALYAFYFGVR